MAGCYVKQHTYLNKVDELKQLKETYDNEIRIKAIAQQQDVGEGV